MSTSTRSLCGIPRPLGAAAHAANTPSSARAHPQTCSMGARRSGGRRGDSRWELAPGEAGLRVVAVKLHQQYETPAAVMHFVRRKWAPTFDAMATPFSTICGEYATIETDILRPESVPAGSVVFVNPAYAPTEAHNGTDLKMWGRLCVTPTCRIRSGRGDRDFVDNEASSQKGPEVHLPCGKDNTQQSHLRFCT